MLLEEVTGLDRAAMIACERDVLDDGADRRFEALLARRATGEPVSQILGRREFYGRTFRVTSDVLTPRPETEMLVEAALEALPPGGRVLDAGTGSGCLLLSVLAERPDATGRGFDVSEAALAVAAVNAAGVGVTARAALSQDRFETFSETGFDVLVCNPPYIAEAADLPADVRHFEPAGALFAGTDGLDAYRVLASKAPGWLSPGGAAFFEIGAGQGEAVAALMRRGFGAPCDVSVLPDLAGLDRMIAVRTGR
ncbi:release factor glutamine methyltransferase [Parvularcula dongshanensis]|uniref:Release factor glutamine methyltransferase n=1 Tax=Parvularcula dongshanensis TaxID=1173995 RepID=A0A840I781_9PROT|nr:release factor glutamine methyltransferase [Parvularcula dongshanensis]